jgi:hypothetical protein
MAEVSATPSVEEGSQSESSKTLPSAEELRSQFRHILMLLNFATAFNHGHSVLHDVAYEAAFDKDNDAEYGQLSQPVLLNALAVLLVTRKTEEVVATADFITEDAINIVVVKNPHSSDNFFSEVEMKDKTKHCKVIECNNSDVDFAMPTVSHTRDTLWMNILSLSYVFLITTCTS